MNHFEQSKPIPSRRVLQFLSRTVTKFRLLVGSEAHGVSVVSVVTGAETN